MPPFGQNKVGRAMKIPKKILVYVYEDLLGDALLKLPFVCSLRTLFPKAHITWCAGGGHTFYKKAFSPLIAPYLDEVIELPLGRGWGEAFQSSPLAKEHFDLIIDTQRDLLPTLMLKKIPHAMFLSRTCRFLFSDFKPHKKMSWKGHLSERLLKLVSVYTKKPVKAIPFQVSNLTAQRKNVAPFFRKKKVFVGFAPGAGNQKKCWPKENFLKVARVFESQGCVPVFILGPAEGYLHKFLKKGCSTAIFPLQEKPELLKDPLNTTALGFYLDFCLVNDAGVGHLMGLSPTHLVTLFGPTEARKVHPLAQKITVMRAQKFGSDRMEDIPFQDVLDTLKAIEKSL